MSGTTVHGDKKILITSYSYARFGGAELNAVELADQLVRFGMKPTFFSYDIDGPLKEYIEKRFHTKILTDRIHQLAENDSDDETGITRVDIADYDYVWIGGNTIPISILRQINTAKKLPKFIFIHMSQLIAFPLDAPLMPDFEKKIASSILSISQKTTTDNIQRILGDKVEIDNWRNPAPVEFKKLPKRSGSLRRIAVISSSHPSDEIMSIGGILEKRGMEVDYVGRFNNNVKVVDAAFYDSYDLIVGIGKNARYSLVSGVPIYVYGRFGGSGYVSEVNIEKNELYNFSGRGFGGKDAETIVGEIINEYSVALEFHNKNRERFIQELSIDNVARNIFEKIEKRKEVVVKFDTSYINWLISIQILLMQRLHFAAWHSAGNEQIKNMQSDIRQMKERNVTIATQNENIKKELSDVTRSHSWRLTQPLRSAGDLHRKIRKKLSGR